MLDATARTLSTSVQILKHRWLTVRHELASRAIRELDELEEGRDAA